MASEALTVTLEVAVHALLNDALPADLAAVKPAPYFRYSFLDGQRVVTEAVGKTGWEAVKAPSAGDASALAAAAAKPADKGKGAPAGKAAEEAVPVGPTLFRHVSSFAGISADADFARRLHEQPTMSFFLGSRFEEPAAPGSAAAAAAPPPAKGGKGAPAAAATAATGGAGHKPFLCWFPLDVSPLLAGQQAVSVVYGDAAAAAAVVGSSSSTATAAGGDGTAAVDLPALLGAPVPDAAFQPPSLFRFLHLSIRVTAATQVKAASSASGAAAAAPAPAPAPAPAKGGKAAPAPAAAAAPATTTVTITPPRLLSDALTKLLNPLKLTVVAAANLPGLRLPYGSDASLKQYVEPDAWELQRRLCRPTYAVIRLFEGAAATASMTSTQGKKKVMLTNVLTTGSGSGSTAASTSVAVTTPVAAPPLRVLATPMVPPGAAASWNHATVICAGLLPAQHLRQALSTSSVVVEVHDRDCIDYERIQERARGTVLPASAPTPAAAAAATPAATTPTASEALSLAKLLPAILPPACGACSLPVERLSWAEAVLAGTAPWPAEEGGAEAGTGSRPPSPSRPASSKGAKPAAAPAPAAAAPAPGSTGPKELADVESLLLAEAAHRVLTARDAHAHGAATYRLEQLLNRAGERRGVLKQKWQGNSGEDGEESMQLSLTAPLVSCNRRTKPKLPEPLHLLSREQNLIIQPGAYLSTAATLKLQVSLASPAALHPTLVTTADAPPPFQRLVVMFPYHSDAMLERVMDVLAKQNLSGCAGAVSFRSHALSAEQRSAADTGAMDIVTGFHIIDGDRRMMVLEGLQGGMDAVRAAVPRDQPNSAVFHLLDNPAIRFSERLYTAFNLSPKEIRLREPLDALATSPVLFDRQAVDDVLRDTVVALRELARADKLSSARQLALFPTTAGLLELETKFGDSVSLTDVYGTQHPASHALEETRTRLQEALHLAETHVVAAVHTELLLSRTLGPDWAATLNSTARGGDGNEGAAEGAAAGAGRSRKRTATAIRKDITDCWNDEYFSATVDAEAARAATNYVARNVQKVDEASVAVTQNKHASLAATVGPDKAAAMLSLERGQTLDTAGRAPPGGQVFLYSGQKLNTGEWQKELMRQRLAADRTGTYTYSPAFGSLTVSLVNEAEIASRAAAAHKAAFKTPKGFVYPAAKALADDLVHPKRPAPQRVDDLKTSWVDPFEMEAVARAASQAAAVVSGRDIFKSNPEPAPLRTKRGAFGYIAVDGSDHTQEYFHTVHLCGDALEAEQQAFKQAKEEEWRRKLVVDSVSFMPHHSTDGAARIERYHSMLRQPPAKVALQHLHSTRLPSGKAVPLEPAPASIMIDNGYAEPLALAGTLRATDTAGFLARTATGEPADFKGVAVHDQSKRSHVYRPLADAGLRTTAPIGRRPADMIPAHVRGVNTDQRAPALHR